MDAREYEEANWGVERAEMCRRRPSGVGKSRSATVKYLVLGTVQWCGVS